jgi:hypothetical protein
VPFRHELVLQSIPLSKQPFKTQLQIENEDVTWSPRYPLLTTRTDMRMALSLQEVESDDGFLILHIVLETCFIEFKHRFHMNFVCHFYILRLTSWIWTSASTEGLKFESPSKWNTYKGFNLEHWLWARDFPCVGVRCSSFVDKVAFRHRSASTSNCGYGRGWGTSILVCKGKIFLSVLMAGVMCLHFSMQGKDILECTNGKCHVCTL